MNRSHFRLWDKKKKEMLYSKEKGEKCFWCYEYNHKRKSDLFLMQCLGILDKEDKPIFEGDIVVFGSHRYEVYNNENADWIMGKKEEHYRIGIYKHMVKVIGNVFEHPHLKKREHVEVVQ